MLGWFVLLAYGATGALLVQRAGRDGLNLLFDTFVAVAASIVVLELSLLFLFYSGVEFLDSLSSLPLIGFSANRNAFAFQLLLAVCLAFALRQKNSAVLAGILCAGLWFCGSRAVYIAIPVVMVMAAIMGCLPLRRMIAVSATAIAIILFVSFIPGFVTYLLDAPALGSAQGIVHQIISPSAGDDQHIKTMLDGWAMFLAHPIFGAGLGAYMHREVLAGTPLVIHSTPLWLMAEVGILGLVVMVAPIVRIFWSEVRKVRENDTAGVALVLIITAFAVVCNIHEIMYQRALWLLMGAALACPPRAFVSSKAKQQ